MVRDVTCNAQTTPSHSNMLSIAARTETDQDIGEILYVVLHRLGDDGRKWRHVQKSLVLLEILVRYGTTRFVTQVSRNLIQIKTLCQFQYFDELNRDCGTDIRERAKNLTKLLENKEELTKARTKARERPVAHGSSAALYGASIDTMTEEQQVQLALKISRQNSNDASFIRHDHPQSIQPSITVDLLSDPIPEAPFNHQASINHSQSSMLSQHVPLDPYQSVPSNPYQSVSSNPYQQISNNQQAFQSHQPPLNLQASLNLTTAMTHSQPFADVSRPQQPIESFYQPAVDSQAMFQRSNSHLEINNPFQAVAPTDFQQPFMNQQMTDGRFSQPNIAIFDAQQTNPFATVSRAAPTADSSPPPLNANPFKGSKQLQWNPNMQ